MEVESLSHLFAAQFQRSISYLDTMARRASTSHNGGVEEKKEPTFFKIIKPGFNTEHLVVSTFKPWPFSFESYCFSANHACVLVSVLDFVQKKLFDFDLGHNHYETTIN